MSIKDLDRITFLAVKYIEDENNVSIKPYIDTISSFINNSKKSPHKNFYEKHKDVSEFFKKRISKTDIQQSLNRNVGDKNLIKNKINDKYLYSINNSQQITVSNNEKTEPPSKTKNKTKKRTTKRKSKYTKYTYDEFLNLANWTKKSSVVKANDGLLVKTKTGFEFYVGSHDEKNTFNRLNKDPKVIDIRGQDYIVRYGRDKQYHPDLAVYYKDCTIKFVEVKEIIQMATSNVLKKYDALITHCKKMGFRYEMCDTPTPYSKTRTLKEIRKKGSNKKLKEKIDQCIADKGFFDDKDFSNYRSKIKGTANKKALSLDLVNIVIKNLKNYHLSPKKGENLHTWQLKKHKKPKRRYKNL